MKEGTLVRAVTDGAEYVGYFISGQEYDFVLSRRWPSRGPDDRFGLLTECFRLEAMQAADDSARRLQV